MRVAANGYNGDGRQNSRQSTYGEGVRNPRAKQRALCIASSPEEPDLAELRELLRTAGVAVAGEMTQRRPEPDPNAYFGKGKLVAAVAEIEKLALARGLSVFASGNFSITAALMTRFALMAAKHVADVEVIDYASAKKPDTPSGTGRELAERLSAIRKPSNAKPVNELSGARETRGATIGSVQVHSVRMPGYLLSCEAVFGAPDERLVIRHDAGTSAAPYVSGTLLAARRVREVKGLRRGLDQLLD